MCDVCSCDGFLFCYVGGLVWEYFVEGVNVEVLLWCDVYDGCEIVCECFVVLDLVLCWLVWYFFV